MPPLPGLELKSCSVPATRVVGYWYVVTAVTEILLGVT
jgi:hypothetical protein